MKIIPQFFFIVLTCSLFTCSSDEPDPNANPGGGSGGDITVTSITPETFYADDELVINGTGFSTDKSKITVQMGHHATGDFNPFGATSDSDPSFEIVSATSTKIIAKAKEPETINGRMEFDAQWRVKVTSNGKSAEGSLKHSRSFVVLIHSLSNVINKPPGCLLYVQAGDSLFLDVGNLYGSHILEIDGKVISNTKMVGDNKLHLRIPRDLFGYLEDYCGERLVPIKLTNADGKSKVKEYHIATSPPMARYSSSFDKPKYTGADDFAYLTVNGYCLYSTATLRLSSNLGHEAESALGAQFYPDKVVVPFTLSALPPATYNVQLRRDDNTDYGFSIASFIKE